MTHAHHAHSLRARMRLIVAAAGCLLAVAALALLPSTVRADEAKGYGELTRFGETGDGLGQLDETRTRALGVDPSEGNSVFVLDEPKKPKKVLKTTVRSFRLQKFTESSGKYALSASVEFHETYAKVGGEEEGESEPTAEGLAVDPAEGRVYLLAVDFREKEKGTGKIDQEAEGADLPVASTLYAFSTKTESGAKLVPASGTKTLGSEEVGVLDGATELNAQSQTAGKALLAPHGITVDPQTHEVIILAHIDPTGALVDSLANDHYVLQRVKSTGVLGDEYVDSTNKLKEVNLQQGFTPQPHSPIVVLSSGNKEHVYVGFNGLAEIPYDFTSTETPKTLPLAENPLGHGAVEGGVSRSPAGGRLAASPEGTIFGANEGTTNEEFGEKPEPVAGIVAFSGADGSLIGWTGGQVPHDEDDHCVLTPYDFSEGLFTSVAAGSEGKVFALAPEFLLRQKEGTPIVEEIEEPVGSGEFVVIEKPTFEALPEPYFGSVVEFGPGGGGCPKVGVEAPVAKVGGIEVKGEELVKPGDEVTFSSHVKQADALKVVWSFGDGSEETISEDEYTATSSKPHKYPNEGKYTVTEKIYSDNLAAPGESVYQAGQLTTPTLEVTRTIDVGRQPPKAQFTGPAGVNVGETASFESTSTDPEHALPMEYVWSFGDGTPETARSTTATASHIYTQAGSYTVTLTVYDQNKLKSETTQEITVSQPGPPPGGGGGGGGGGSGGGGGGSNPGGGGSGGVPSYNLSLAGSSLTVSSSGALALKVDCLGQSGCTSGTVVLRTLSAVSSGRHKKKAILTLATGSFTVAGGQVGVVTLHLSSQARSLLSHSHVLRASVTIVAHDSQGVAHTVQTTVTLSLAKAKAKTKKHHG
jgi:PKD repeat protein